MQTNYPKVALYDPSSSGGISHYTFELAEGLVKTGCSVTVITSDDYELRDLDRHFDVWFLFKPSRVTSWSSKAFRGNPAVSRRHAAGPESSPVGDHRPISWLIGWLKSLRYTMALSKAAFILRVNGTRIVHIHWMIDRRADLRFMRLLRLMRLKVVYTAHNLLPHDEHTPENRAFYEHVYRVPDRLIVHSENNRKEMLELFTVDPEKITVIPHGCHRLLFEQAGARPVMTRQELGIPDDRRVILFFGLIKRYKGLDVLLQAFETIRSRCDKVMLLIAGPIAGDPEVHRRYSTLLANYSSDDSVRVRTGYVPLDQVASYFSAADLVVLPYLKASQSGVLLAAYAAGKPVVVTDTGGLSEVVRNGDSGLVVPPNNAQAIAEASITILNDRALRERLGREAKRLAATTFSWTAIGRTTAELYQGLIHSDQSRPNGHRNMRYSV